MKHILFDIDGTLVTGGNAHLDAFFGTFAMMFGIRPLFELDAETPMLDGASVAGATDLGLLRNAARAAGIELRAAQEQEFFGAYAEVYLGRLRADPTLAGTAVRGLQLLLAHLRASDVTVWLSTGNARQIAAAKLQSVGAWGVFTTLQVSGFGDMHETRQDLVDAIVAAIGPAATTRDEIVLVGDTAADMAAASRLCGIGITTGSASRAVLEGAGARIVVDGLDEVAQVLARSSVAL